MRRAAPAAPHGQPRTRTGAAPALAGLALLALLALAGGCAKEQKEALGPEDWVNPDAGTTAEPVSVPATQLPYTGTVTEGIHYVRIEGITPHSPMYVTLTGKRADADLFVLGNSAFNQFECASVRGGDEDDRCATSPTASTTLYVEVYGFTGNETEFVLDVY